MPEQRTGDVPAHDFVELGEPFVGLDPRVHVFGRARVLEQAFGKMGCQATFSFVSFGANASEGTVLGL